MDLRAGWLAFFQREMAEGEGEFFLGLFQKFRDAPVIDEVFEASFFAVGAIAVFDENAYDGGGDWDGFLGCQEDAAIRGELLVTSDAAELHAEVDAGSDAFVVPSTLTA